MAGAGGNIVVQAGDEGLLVVDTGRTETSAQVLALLQQQFNRPIRFVINTSADPDHIGGNATIGGAGRARRRSRRAAARASSAARRQARRSTRTRRCSTG